jgi:hypothetical protein
MSNTLRLSEDGDIMFNQVGRLEWIIDESEKVVQSIYLRLKTLKGELYYEDEYGHPALKGKINKESAEIYFKDTLLDDENIESLSVINFYEVKDDNIKGAYSADIEIYLTNGDSIDITAEI